MATNTTKAPADTKTADTGTKATGTRKPQEHVIDQPVGDGFMWEEPPTTSHSGGSRNPDAYAAEAQLLRTHPHQWARLHTFTGKSAASGAYRLRKRIKDGALPAFGQPADYETRSAKVDGGVAVYARFIKGPVSNTAENVQADDTAATAE